jgi:signal peptidase I
MSVMEAKPKTWIATLLGFLQAPLGFLYLARPWLALGYLVLQIAVVVVDIYSLSRGLLPFSISWLYMPAGAIHCFFTARSIKEPVPRRWYSRWYGLASIAASPVILVGLIRAFLFEPFHFPSESMRPFLNPGDYFFVKKLGYGHYNAFGLMLRRSEVSVPIKRGEVLIFSVPADPSTAYAKRVIGLPGDRIRFEGERLHINGQPIATKCRNEEAVHRCVETLDDQQFEVLYRQDRYSKDADVTVPEGHYFMMGDNRNHSQDSRYLGFIPRENIRGRVAHIWWKAK